MINPARFSGFGPTVGSACDAVESLLDRGELRAVGLERVERLCGNVGYIDFRAFADVARAAPTVAVVLDLLGDTDALIIDLRRNRGGDRATAALLSSFLFDTEPVHLDAVFWSADRRSRGLRAVPRVPGARYVGREVYVLVGAQTSPAAAELARTLRELDRATVVGEAPRAAAPRATDSAIVDRCVPELLAMHVAHLEALRHLARSAPGEAVEEEILRSIKYVQHELRSSAVAGSSRQIS
ncbi:MAG: S41 family peptidase [Gemmatimonadaceae bacterium]